MSRVLQVNDPSSNRSWTEAGPSTISDTIQLQATLHPERPAIVCAGLPAFSFRELDRKIRQIGDDLRVAGIGASSRVGVVLPFGPEAAVVAVAVSAHAIGFPLNPALTATEFEFELTRADLDAVVLPGWIDLPAAALARARSIGVFHASRATHSLAEISLEPVVEVPSARQRSGAPSPRSVSVIQMSSGSTGTPKLILVTHANLFDIAGKMRTWLALSANDRCACILPIYAGFGFKIALLAPLLIGSSVAIAKKQQPEDIAAWISDLDPTWFVATPTYLHAALDKLRSAADGKVVHSLRFFASTSAYLPEAVRRGLESILGIPGLEYYGMGEAGIIAANPAPPATRKPGSVGLISRDVAILNSEGEILPRGAAGAIAVRGQGVSPGYIEALPLGCDTLPDTDTSPNKWALTGDLGVVDADGFLSIVGRTKEIINRGGEKVSPYEVEKALLQHPAVREAGVFAVPHPRLGENVAAAVVLHRGADATSSDIQQFLYANLAPCMVPQQIFILERISKGRTGKIDRAKLSETFAHHVPRPAPPQNALESDILNIWRRLIEREDIGVEDNFFEAGGDSLIVVQMLLEVEAMIGHRVPATALQNVYSIRQLASVAMTLPSSTSEVVTCAQDGGGIPFFFCHGDYNMRGVYVAKLVELLGKDQTVFVVHPWRTTREPITIEEMARSYAPELAALYPSGPLRIGGHCNGGLLAWALAHEFEKMGRRIEFIVFLDTFSFNARPALRRAEQALKLAQRLVPAAISEKIERNGMRTLWQVLQWVDRPVTITQIIRWTYKRIVHCIRTNDRTYLHEDIESSRYLTIMSKYIPPKIDCALLCLTSEEMQKKLSRSPWPWHKLARRVSTEHIPGSHLDVILGNLEEFARILRRHLVAD